MRHTHSVSAPNLCREHTPRPKPVKPARRTCITGLAVKSTEPCWRRFNSEQRKTPSLRERAKSTNATSGLVTLCVGGITPLSISHCLACLQSTVSWSPVVAILSGRRVLKTGEWKARRGERGEIRVPFCSLVSLGRCGGTSGNS